jgi:hypothetical protein
VVPLLLLAHPPVAHLRAHLAGGGRAAIPHGPEAFALFGGNVVIECRDGNTPVQLAMAAGSVTALLAWLESLPPGRSSSRVL